MSDTNKILLEWFKKNLPKDFYLSDEIIKRASKVFKNVKVHPDRNIRTPFFMGVSNARDDPSRLTIAMNVYGAIYTGVMAKAILDSLTAEFEGLLSSEIGSKVLNKKVREIVAEYMPLQEEKECLNCNTKNILKAKYCLECGEPFKTN